MNARMWRRVSGVFAGERFFQNTVRVIICAIITYLLAPGVRSRLTTPWLLTIVDPTFGPAVAAAASFPLVVLIVRDRIYSFAKRGLNNSRESPWPPGFDRELFGHLFWFPLVPLVVLSAGSYGTFAWQG